MLDRVDSPDDLKKLQRSLPSAQPWEGLAAETPPSPPPPPPSHSPAVTEWANRAAIFTRMVSRAYTTKDAPADVLTALSRTWATAPGADWRASV